MGIFSSQDLLHRDQQLNPATPKLRRRNKPSTKIFHTVPAISPTPVSKSTSCVEIFNDRDPDPETSTFRRLVEKAGSPYDYQNCPLRKDHLRLLFLKPSKDPNTDIIVKLQAVQITDVIRRPENHQFTALSYNWGNGKEEDKIFVDMAPDTSPDHKEASRDLSTVWKHRMPTIRVKPNLYAFLKEFRDTREPVALWVDRVCINQADNKEKADQVSKMSFIFSIAANVVIWLGPPDEEGKSDRAMDFIGSMLSQDVERNLRNSPQTARQWSDLLSLMRRPWFSRRWIIQELALAKNAEVRCGSQRVHWRDFSDAVSIFELHFDTILKIIRDKPDLERIPDGIRDIKPFGARILVDVLSNTFRRHANGTIHSPRQGLESLISSLSTFETSDPRDTIYALLNLAKETFNLPSENMVSKDRRQRKHATNPPPFPDYSKNLLDVYTDFMKWCVKESDSLDILCCHWALPEVQVKPNRIYPDLVELPSWVMTVHKSAYGSQREGFGGRKTGDSFVGSPESRCYNASLNRPPVVQWGRDRGQGVSPTGLAPRQFGLARAAKHLRRRLCSGKKISRMLRSRKGINHTLSVRGFYLGEVLGRHRMPEGDIPEKVLEMLGHDPSQSTLDRAPEDLWRTLVADRGPDGKAPPPLYHRACMMCLAANESARDLDTNQMLQQKSTTKMQADYLKRVQAVCWNRTFIECGDDDDGNKLFGVAPLDVEPGDLVCILYGCSVPCILRPTLYGGEKDLKASGSEDSECFYRLIGEAFILGRMDGEALMDLSEEDLQGVSDDFLLA